MKFLSSYEQQPTKKAVREAIARFMKDGQSGLHSEGGMLLSHILNHCATNKIEFTLQFAPGGFYVRKGLTPQLSVQEYRLLKYVVEEAEGWRGSLTGDPDTSTLEAFDKRIKATKEVLKKLAPAKRGRR